MRKDFHFDHFDCHAFHSYGSLSQVDSDTEMDEAVTLRYTSREHKWRVRQWLDTVRQTVVMWLSSGVDFVNVRIPRRNNVSTSHDYYRCQGELIYFNNLLYEFK